MIHHGAERYSFSNLEITLNKGESKPELAVGFRTLFFALQYFFFNNYMSQYVTNCFYKTAFRMFKDSPPISVTRRVLFCRLKSSYVEQTCGGISSLPIPFFATLNLRPHMRANRAGEPTPSCRYGVAWCLVRRKQLIVTSLIDAYGRSRTV